MSHDALVLVHPTYKKEKRPKGYPYRLLDAIDVASQHNIPVFCVPDDGNYKWLYRHLSKRHIIQIPNYLRNDISVKYRVLRRRLQNEVNFIAKMLGKHPAEIRLGFAGMYAAACVFGIAQSWCRQVVPWYPDWSNSKRRACLPKHPIARAEILEELVVGFDEDEHLIPACNRRLRPVTPAARAPGVTGSARS